MKALVGAFNQEKALVGAFSVIVQLHRLIDLRHYLDVRLPVQQRLLDDLEHDVALLVRLQEEDDLDLVEEAATVLMLTLILAVPAVIGNTVNTIIIATIIIIFITLLSLINLFFSVFVFVIGNTMNIIIIATIITIIVNTFMITNVTISKLIFASSSPACI